jgi:hypothetical protein
VAAAQVDQPLHHGAERRPEEPVEARPEQGIDASLEVDRRYEKIVDALLQ